MQFEGTLILVSHDRDFLQGLTNRVVEFNNKKITEFIGDIYDYLDAKKLESLQELELKPAASKTEAAKQKPVAKDLHSEKKIKSKELKKLEKAIALSEERIAAIETNISEIEKQLQEPEFYNANQNNTAFFDNYNALKQQLAAELAGWESHINSMEQFKSENPDVS